MYPGRGTALLIALLTWTTAMGITAPVSGEATDPAPHGDQPPRDQQTNTVRLVYNGTTDGQVCTFVASCMRYDEGAHIEEPLAAPGTPTRFTAEVTHDALADRIAFFLIVEQADGSRAWDSDTEVFRGASPVQIDWDLTPYEGRQTWVRASSLVVAASVSQDFHMDGLVHHAPDHEPVT